MHASEHNKRRVVLGLGNLLFRDEGFGTQAVKAMRDEWGSRYPVEWLDGGVLGLQLLPVVEDCSHLLLLDAVDADLPGGSLVEMTRDEIPLFGGIKMSEHQAGFQEVLALANLRQHYPAYLHLVGVQPADLSAGIGLSLQVTAALPAVSRKVGVLLRAWFSSEGNSPTKK